MHEFRYRKWVKVFTVIFCPLLIALFTWMLFEFRSQPTWIYFLIFVPMSLGMITFSVYAVLDVIHGKFIISSDGMKMYAPLGDRSLLFDEVKGFRQSENYIRVIPKDKSKKEIKIPIYLQDKDVIVEWLSTNYVALDVIEGDEEERQILDNESLGITEESRRARLEQARKVCRVVNTGAWMLLGWLFIFPEYYYSYALFICTIYPWIAIFTGLAYRGLVSADEYEGSKMPTLGTAYIIPGITLALRAILDYNIFNYPSAIWVGIVILALIMAFLYLLPSFKPTGRTLRFYGTTAAMIFLSIFYSYGVIVVSNVMLDRSEGEDYESVVLSKRISKGKSTTYYVSLKEWGANNEPHEAKVSSDEYEVIHEGDPVLVRQHNGYLQIPWIEIEFLKTEE